MTGIMETLPRKAPLPRLLARGGALAGVIAALAFPALAQDGTGPVPENGSARSYGSGWECNLGYRVDGDDCLAIDIPEHAYATGQSYGSGWACRRGFEQVGRASCIPIEIPENAFLESAGYDWECDRGYRRGRTSCEAVDLPENAFLSGQVHRNRLDLRTRFRRGGGRLRGHRRAAERLPDQRQLRRCLEMRPRVHRNRWALCLHRGAGKRLP